MQSVNFERTVTYRSGCLSFLDQSLLPHRQKKLRIRDPKTLIQAIYSLQIRGAPAIGIAGAYGVVLAARQLLKRRSRSSFITALSKQADAISAARPTAVNLSWAVSRMKAVLRSSTENSPLAITAVLEKEARTIEEEDIAIGTALGRHGETLISDGDQVLTHCNAGGLATAGMGSALSLFFFAKRAGCKFHVWVDETRPLLQGSRLTTWELSRWKIPHTLICDNMAASLMQQGKIHKVITGADRIAGNGDAANKIGTYSIAALARFHRIPFYIAAPYSTFDPDCATGADIPIEERDPEEVRCVRGERLAPNGTSVYNPAFDVVPASLIRALITEGGLIQRPTARKVRSFLRTSASGR